jgi:hypothetical protein
MSDYPSLSDQNSLTFWSDTGIPQKLVESKLGDPVVITIRGKLKSHSATSADIELGSCKVSFEPMSFKEAAQDAEQRVVNRTEPSPG